METDLIVKLENKIQAAIDAFDKSPLRSSVKWIIVSFVLIKLYKYLKKELR